MTSERQGDPNAGSMVLFRRGIGPDGSGVGEWEVGYIEWTFFVDPTGRVVEPDLEHPEHEPWVSISPAAPEGPSAPVRLSVPLDAEHVDPVAHGTEMPR